jgi:flavodoxin
MRFKGPEAIQVGGKKMFEVIYCSRGGNTRKVAEAIASELGVSAKDIRTAGQVPREAFILLGSGNYGGRPVEDVIDFVEKNCGQGGKAAVFGTSAGDKGNEVTSIEKLLVKRGMTVSAGFHCPGKFLFFIRRGRPNEEDLRKAREWARAKAKEAPAKRQ